MTPWHLLGSGTKLVVASHNPGKVKEIAALLGDLPLAFISSGELGISEPEETGDSFEANAALKARHTALAAGLPALADDSGLVVPELDGAPGIYSARWAGPGKDFTHAMKRVENELAQRGVTSGQAKAHFVCVLALAWPDPLHVEYFRGEVHGTLVFPPRGEKGFGYDPIFLPQGSVLTFGEMEPDAKHRISHRAEAFQLFAKFLAPKLTHATMRS